MRNPEKPQDLEMNRLPLHVHLSGPVLVCYDWGKLLIDSLINIEGRHEGPGVSFS